MKTMVIGVDQSYTETGLAIAVNGEIKWCRAEGFNGCANNTEKRRRLSRCISSMLEKYAEKYEIVILCERVRQFSNKGENRQFISMPYIMNTAALIATIIDAAYMYRVPVYSVATTSWKARVCGGIQARDLANAAKKKSPSIEYAKRIGLKDKIQYTVERGKNKGEKRYNDNISDAICIALYWWISGRKINLEKI